MQNSKVYDIKDRCVEFSLGIIRFLESLPTDYIHRTIGKQLLRSATSIGANIVEAQAASSRKDFANFYNIALKSANETKYWIALIEKSGIGKSADVNDMRDEVEQIAKIVAKCILTLKGK